MLHTIPKRHASYPNGVVVFHGRIVRIPVGTCAQWGLAAYRTVEALWDDTEPDIFYLRFHADGKGTASLSRCGALARTFSMMGIRVHFGARFPRGDRVALRGMEEKDGFVRFNIRDVVK